MVFFREIVQLISSILSQDNGPDWAARIKHLMTLAPLSYSLVIMMKDKIYGVRDAYGNRPLCIGKIVPVDSGNRKFHLNFSFLQSSAILIALI